MLNKRILVEKEDLKEEINLLKERAAKFMRMVELTTELHSLAVMDMPSVVEHLESVIGFAFVMQKSCEKRLDEINKVFNQQ